MDIELTEEVFKHGFRNESSKDIAKIVAAAIEAGYSVSSGYFVKDLAYELRYSENIVRELCGQMGLKMQED